MKSVRFHGSNKPGQFIHIRQGERGITLIELLVATVITGILLAVVMKFFVDQTAGFNESRQSSEMQQELRWAINYVTERLKLAGNGVPPTCGFPVLENIDGGGSVPDSVSVIGSFKSLVITTTQTMANEGAQVKVDDASELEPGDLCVISDGTFQEIFFVTSIQNVLHLWHDTALPWNDDAKLDHRYVSGSSITVVTYYSFFVDVDDEGRSNLMVTTQAYPPQILLGDVDNFQIRFKMKNGSWLDETTPDEITDIRMIEITIRARSHEPLQGYLDPEYGDAYKRIEMQSVVIPKNITIL